MPGDELNMNKWNVALAYYQNRETAREAVQELQKQGICRTATLYTDSKGVVRSVKHYSIPRYLSFLLAVFILITFILYFFLGDLHLKPVGVLVLSVLGGLAALVGVLELSLYGINNKTIKKYKQTVFRDEVLVIAEVTPTQIKETLAILRLVKGGHPATFLLSPDADRTLEKTILLPDNAQTAEELKETATRLSSSTKNTLKSKYRDTELLKELNLIEKRLQTRHKEVSRVEFSEQSSPSSTDWFLDNMPTVQGSIEEIKKNLSVSFYRELPKLYFEGRLLPRVYLIALKLVQSVSGKVEDKNILEFIREYQKLTPLTISELWALPLMLKFCLLDWIHALASQISHRMHTAELANYWGNRLMHASERFHHQLPALMQTLANEIPEPSCQFAEELVDHLFDEERALSLTKKWLESCFFSPLSEVFHREQLDEAEEQLLFSSAMRSLVSLSQIAWQEIFEQLSVVDAILGCDPVKAYSEMDFGSRNLYRDAIEQMNKNSHFSELEIAQKCVALAKEGHSTFSRHVGYYLIDEGRDKLEAIFSYRAPLKQKIQRLIKQYPSAFYLGTVASVVVVLESFLFVFGVDLGQSVSLLLFLGFFALLPISEIATHLLNFFLARFLPVSILPKMEFKGEIPEQYKTLVVVPMMLNSIDDIQEEVDRLEVRYLANNDPQIRYSLFSDFNDAPQQHMESDQPLLEHTLKLIRQLDEKYGPGKFFLFHRQRVWSKSEHAWIGWERKRGKLESLNRYLMGDFHPENILYFGSSNDLQGIRFIITLDSDTQLSKHQGKKLIEMLAHPLNAPILRPDGRSLERGYTIIQPTVCTDFPHTKDSRFLQIFSDPTVIDPYTHAISNTFQDLTGEAAYHGKGIYDLKAFHTILTGRYPEEHILSHDLIEGAYVRVGYTGAVCLFDIFPENYLGVMNRLRRWIRGDWQIIDWIFPTIPTNGGKKERNPLSLLNRWKIFDNLRRSLVPLSLMVIFVTAWLWTSDIVIWTLLGVAVLFLPAFLQAFAQLFHKISYKTLMAWSDVSLSFQRAIVNTSLLPQEAFYTLDSIVRVFYRRLISRRQLLEWTTSKYINKTSEQAFNSFLLRLGFGSLFSVVLIFLIARMNPIALSSALPICMLWILGPFILQYMTKPIEKGGPKSITEIDRLFLRNVARKIWRYFDDFVGNETNWLPPDNYQSALNVGIAPRTSPTNIGLWLLAVTNAYDMKFITCDRAIEKISKTIASLQQLERFQGHFLNWYDTSNLHPLYPRYISTVDSGNLLACFWTLGQTLSEMTTAPLVMPTIFDGLADTYRIATKGEKGSEELQRLIETLEGIYYDEHKSIIDILAKITRGSEAVQNYRLNDREDSQKNQYWLEVFEKEFVMWEEFLHRYFNWVPLLTSLPEKMLDQMDAQARSWIDQTIELNFSLKDLAEGKLQTALQPLFTACQKQGVSAEIKRWSGELKEAIATAQWLAGEKLAEYEHAIDYFEMTASEMNLRYLYSQERKLFSIGYNVDDQRLDRSHYDLLASEARIASLVAIAKNDVPLDHWWALSKPYGLANGVRVLLSWGGTMFEYLMPVLFSKHYPDSLIGSACDAAVECQIRYGKLRGIPWGISESAYSTIDSNKIYQYQSFGVYGLGLKRGLEKDLVVSPYSSLLALAINPRAAIDNLHRLSKEKNSLWGNYGFYESIDFTRQGDQEGARGVVVFTFMAHHQGMSFGAINNLLNEDIIASRFHRNPRISGVEFLLFERVPLAPSITTKGYRKDEGPIKLKPFSTIPILGVAETPNTSIPKVNILSNHKFSTMITNSGGGFSHWKGIDITRWRSDTTMDSWGAYCYIKEIENNTVWSTTYQPTLKMGEHYSSSFKSNKVEFRRLDHGIETAMELVISPDDDAEIRFLTFHNKSKRRRELEVTSYQELVLAPHNADRAHPAFNKLFIETEAVKELNGLIAFRRLRSPSDTPLWAGHLIITDRESTHPYETSRALFIGRNRTLEQPIALDRELTNTAGTVLDPIFSLRDRFILEPEKIVKIAFVTLMADSREALIALMQKYQHLDVVHQVIEKSWTYSQLELRHLNITSEDVQLYQKLASRILYPHKQLRSSPERLKDNTLTRSTLWKYGISGDIPLVVVSIDDAYDTVLAKQMLIAQAFLRSRQLKFDLLILNEEDVGYENPLHEQLKRLVDAYGCRPEPGVPGCIYLRNIHDLPDQDLTLLLSAAHVFLKAARGSLRQQLVSPMPPTHLPEKFTPARGRNEGPSRPLPFLELPYFNGLGGYSPDGKSYSIYLGPETTTPSPWINVIANPSFGTLVSESGSGVTWFGNSQANRLTTWSNDPTSNPITDVIYIRDEDTGSVWTPTALPIREKDAYRATHGQGYSLFEHNSHEIEQQLLIVVPMDEQGGIPLRIQRLRLHNHSNESRNLTVTSYQDLVLGGNKEETQLHIVTEWNKPHHTLFAYNRYQSPFGSYSAFTTSIPSPESFTGDRTEFIGRNGSLSHPEALTRKSLSNHSGPGFDPCASLQVKIQIPANGSEEVYFLLGYAENDEAACKILSSYSTKEAIEQLIDTNQKWWDHLSSSLEVDVPDLQVNFALNRWLPYQNLSCRFWGRTAFYQSSGAYGFRDQLQDVMALIYSEPGLAREHIIRTAARQFIEGDVQHWWDPNTGAGVRTRFSDDLLWLPFVTAQYVRTTGDLTILEEEIPFLSAPLLEVDQHEVYNVPEISTDTGSLFEHCRRAIVKGLTKGPHGLPLMGGGDWNDGMNRVGIQGQGESVWLAWFLIHVLKDYAEMLTFSGRTDDTINFFEEVERLARTVEETAWDGEWYRRAYYDSGSPLGSKQSDEAKIDSLAQSWAVLSGSGDPNRSKTALESAYKHLVRVEEKVVLLLTPPFDKTPEDPGYIKGYPPGVRENGGQYTHGCLWLAMAYARVGKGNTAVDLLKMMHPQSHTQNLDQLERYKIEPFVTAGDVYDLKGEVGRGGWSWYTGSAAWMYRIWIEEILGFKLRGDKFYIESCIPKEWNGFTFRYRYKTSLYAITLSNPDHLSKGKNLITVDGTPHQGEFISLLDDGKTHLVQITLHE